jgi:lipopolysaccharide export LptBFGC system permease protein LptF
MRIKIEDYYGNDIIELNVKKLDNNTYEENIFYREGIDIKETNEYNIADVDEDEYGEYVRVQLSTNEIRTINTID